MRRNCHFFWQQQSYAPLNDEQTLIALPDKQLLAQTDHLPTRLYHNRWQWQTSVKGTENTPNLGCNKVQPIKKVLIKLNANRHDILGWRLKQYN